MWMDENILCLVFSVSRWIAISVHNDSVPRENLVVFFYFGKLSREIRFFILYNIFFLWYFTANEVTNIFFFFERILIPSLYVKWNGISSIFFLSFGKNHCLILPDHHHYHSVVHHHHWTIVIVIMLLYRCCCCSIHGRNRRKICTESVIFFVTSFFYFLFA